MCGMYKGWMCAEHMIGMCVCEACRWCMCTVELHCCGCISQVGDVFCKPFVIWHFVICEWPYMYM